jgi:hypothetical protein
MSWKKKWIGILYERRPNPFYWRVSKLSILNFKIKMPFLWKSKPLLKSLPKPKNHNKYRLFLLRLKNLKVKNKLVILTINIKIDRSIRQKRKLCSKTNNMKFQAWFNNSNSCKNLSKKRFSWNKRKSNSLWRKLQ